MASIMKHVHEIWFERICHRVPSSKLMSISHVLVVATDLLTDLDVLDIESLDYLEIDLRRLYKEADDIRFVPAARVPRQTIQMPGPATPVIPVQ